MIKKTEAVIYIMASKFLNQEEQDFLKGAIKMLPFTQMIWDDAMKEGREEGIKKGIEEGIEKGIQGLIKVCKQVNMEYEQIINNLVDVYTLTIEKAEMYMKKYY